MPIHPVGQPQGNAHGDLRNKARRDEQTARIRAMQRQMEGGRAAADPLRCLCGKTAGEVEAMWAYQADRWSAMRFYCPACLPTDLSRLE
jgi:hypothetical protein